MSVVPLLETPADNLVGKSFELTQDITTVDHVFEKDTILVCTYVLHGINEPKEVMLKDSNENSLLLDYDSFCRKLK